MPKQSQVSRGSGSGKSGRTATRGRKSNNQFVLLWVIGGVLVVLIGVLLLNQQALTAGISNSASSQGSTGGPSWGPVGAPVTIVEYSNFGCIHCKNFAQQDEPQLRKEYEASGKVRFEFRQFDLGNPPAKDAANASLCAADQNRFWDYHDVLFRNQGLSATAFSKGSLKEYGKQLGLDTAKFNACVDGNQRMDQVDQNTAEGSKLGVNATPTMFINGTMQQGELPYDQLKAKIEAAIQTKGG